MHILRTGRRATIAGLAALCAVATAFSADWRAWQREQDGIDPAKRDLGGLDLRIGLDKQSGWPRLGREMLIGFDRHTDKSDGGVNASRGYSPIWFGTVHAAGGSAPVVSDCLTTWTGSTLSMAYAPGALAASDVESLLTLRASRLTPGVLVTVPGNLLLFGGTGFAGEKQDHPIKFGGFSGPATPKWFATRSGGEIAIREADKIAELPLDGLGGGWLLCWYGKNSFFHGNTRSSAEIHYGWAGVKIWDDGVYKGDCPFLILFHKAPLWLEADWTQGLEIEPEDQDCRVFVLPLLGELIPKSEDTEEWAGGLPQEIIDRCDWWAAHSDKVPLDAAESYGYDAATDTITITEKFTYEPFRAGNRIAAPVPPVMAVAHLAGFAPLSFSHAPEDAKLFTAVGDYLAVPGVETYEMRFKGLGKYIDPRPAPEGAAPERLVKILEDEVRRIVDAGHLAPWSRIKKNCPGWTGNFVSSQVHYLPGETQHFLAETLPFLSEPLKGEVIAYMKEETDEFPPYAMPALPTDLGARREWYPLSGEFLTNSPASSQHFNNINRFPSGQKFVRDRKLIMSCAPYYMASHYAAAGKDGFEEAWSMVPDIMDQYLNRLDWASGTRQWPDQYADRGGQRSASRYYRAQGDWYGTGGMPDVNNLFAGVIGLARLARLAGDADAEVFARGLFARIAALRYAFGRMTGRLYDCGLLTLTDKQTGKEQDLRVPYAVDEFGMTIRLLIANYQPNGLTLLRDATPELGAFCRDFLKTETMAYYDDMLQYMPHWHLAWVEQGVEDESGCPLPQDQYQTFMAYALVDRKPAAWLESRIDLPWCERGDLYYLAKLAETIRAHMSEH